MAAAGVYVLQQEKNSAVHQCSKTPEVEHAKNSKATQSFKLKHKLQKNKAAFETKKWFGPFDKHISKIL